METATVLHVDPSDEDREELRRRFGAFPNVELVSRPSLAAVEETLAEIDVACVITEFELPERTGFDLVEAVRKFTPDAGCVLYTDADRKTIRAEATSQVAAYVPKGGHAALDRLAHLVETTAKARSQTAYPLPDAERERLTVLDTYHLEGDHLEAALERVMELAARHFDVPSGAVGIIEEHTEEFLACYGQDFPSVPREDTVCTYAILDDDVTVIEDLATDPRFENNEAIEAAGIRFYAGAVITSEEGHAIGTLCIYDEEPREFTTADEEYLQLLGQDAAEWIEHLGRDGDRPDVLEVTGS